MDNVKKPAEDLFAGIDPNTKEKLDYFSDSAAARPQLPGVENTGALPSVADTFGLLKVQGAGSLVSTADVPIVSDARAENDRMRLLFRDQASVEAARDKYLVGGKAGKIAWAEDILAAGAAGLYRPVSVQGMEEMVNLAEWKLGGYQDGTGKLGFSLAPDSEQQGVEAKYNHLLQILTKAHDTGRTIDQAIMTDALYDAAQTMDAPFNEEEAEPILDNVLNLAAQTNAYRMIMGFGVDAYDAVVGDNLSLESLHATSLGAGIMSEGREQFNAERGMAGLPIVSREDAERQFKFEEATEEEKGFAPYQGLLLNDGLDFEGATVNARYYTYETTEDDGTKTKHYAIGFPGDRWLVTTDRDLLNFERQRRFNAELNKIENKPYRQIVQARLQGGLTEAGKQWLNENTQGGSLSESTFQVRNLVSLEQAESFRKLPKDDQELLSSIIGLGRPIADGNGWAKNIYQHLKRGVVEPILSAPTRGAVLMYRRITTSDEDMGRMMANQYTVELLNELGTPTIEYDADNKFYRYSGIFAESLPQTALFMGAGTIGVAGKVAVSAARALKLNRVFGRIASNAARSAKISAAGRKIIEFTASRAPLAVWQTLGGFEQGMHNFALRVENDEEFRRGFDAAARANVATGFALNYLLEFLPVEIGRKFVVNLGMAYNSAKQVSRAAGRTAAMNYFRANVGSTIASEVAQEVVTEMAQTFVQGTVDAEVDYYAKHGDDDWEHFSMPWDKILFDTGASVIPAFVSALALVGITSGAGGTVGLVGMRQHVERLWQRKDAQAASVQALEMLRGKREAQGVHLPAYQKTMDNAVALALRNERERLGRDLEQEEVETITRKAQDGVALQDLYQVYNKWNTTQDAQAKKRYLADLGFSEVEIGQMEDFFNQMFKVRRGTQFGEQVTDNAASINDALKANGLDTFVQAEDIPDGSGVLLRFNGENGATTVRYVQQIKGDEAMEKRGLFEPGRVFVQNMDGTETDISEVANDLIEVREQSLAGTTFVFGHELAHNILDIAKRSGVLTDEMQGELTKRFHDKDGAFDEEAFADAFGERVKLAFMANQENLAEMGRAGRVLDTLAKWVRALAEALHAVRPRQGLDGAGSVLDAFLKETAPSQGAERTLRESGVPVNEINEMEEAQAQQEPAQETSAPEEKQRAQAKRRHLMERRRRKYSTESVWDEPTVTVRSVRNAVERDGDKAVELLGGTVLSNYMMEETDEALRKRVARAAVEKLFNVVPVSDGRLRQAGLIEKTMALPEDEDEVASEYEDAKIVDARNRSEHGGVLVGESQAEAVVRARAKQVFGKTFRYLFEVYHGTPHAGWTRWERGYGGTTGLGYAYFAPRVITAAEYADTYGTPNNGLADISDMQRFGISEAVYHMVVGMNNPLIVDCRRASWNNIRMKNKRTVRTDEILNVLRFGELGYDGVIFLNVHDSQLNTKVHGYDVDVVPLGPVGKNGKNGDVSRQMKSLDGVTVSDVNVPEFFGAIDILDRFDVKNPDIRHSTERPLEGADAELARLEMEEVRARLEGSELWMKAPNGKPTKLTERQWLQVRTPSFKAWFGDWENDPENASKVVDENGEPMVYYHGTPNQFTVFDSVKNGSTTNAGWLGDGFYFTDDYRRARNYASASGGRVVEVFLNVREPYYIPYDETEELAEADDRDKSIAFAERVKDDGYDGVFYEDEAKDIAVFDPAQIKSATDNTGAFDPSNPDIRHSTEAVGTPRFSETREGKRIVAALVDNLIAHQVDLAFGNEAVAERLAQKGNAGVGKWNKVTRVSENGTVLPGSAEELAREEAFRAWQFGRPGGEDLKGLVRACGGAANWLDVVGTAYETLTAIRSGNVLGGLNKTVAERFGKNEKEAVGWYVQRIVSARATDFGQKCYLMGRKFATDLMREANASAIAELRREYEGKLSEERGKTRKAKERARGLERTAERRKANLRAAEAKIDFIKAEADLLTRIYYAYWQGEKRARRKDAREAKRAAAEEAAARDKELSANVRWYESERDFLIAYHVAKQKHLADMRAETLMKKMKETHEQDMLKRARKRAIERERGLSWSELQGVLGFDLLDRLEKAAESEEDLQDLAAKIVAEIDKSFDEHTQRENPDYWEFSETLTIGGKPSVIGLTEQGVRGYAMTASNVLRAIARTVAYGRFRESVLNAADGLYRSQRDTVRMVLEGKILRTLKVMRAGMMSGVAKVAEKRMRSAVAETNKALQGEASSARTRFLREARRVVRELSGVLKKVAAAHDEGKRGENAREKLEEIKQQLENELNVIEGNPEEAAKTLAEDDTLTEMQHRKALTLMFLEKFGDVGTLMNPAEALAKAAEAEQYVRDILAEHVAIFAARKEAAQKAADALSAALPETRGDVPRGWGVLGYVVPSWFDQLRWPLGANAQARAVIDQFERLFSQAAMTEAKLNREDNRRINEMILRAYNVAAKTDGDIQKLGTREWTRLLDERNPEWSNTFSLSGKTLSRANLIYIYASLRQKDVYDKMMKHYRRFAEVGENGEVLKAGIDVYIDNLRSVLTDGDIRLADEVVRYFADKRRPISAVSTSLFGLSVYAPNENYVPLAVELDPSFGTGRVPKQFVILPNFLKNRVWHSRTLDETVSINSIVRERCGQVNRWIAYAELFQFGNMVFRDGEVAKRYESVLGKKNWRNLDKQWMDIFTGVENTGASWWRPIRSVAATLGMSYNLLSAFRQSEGVVAWATDCGVKDTAGAIWGTLEGLFTEEGRERFRAEWNSDIITSRMETGSLLEQRQILAAFEQLSASGKQRNKTVRSAQELFRKYATSGFIPLKYADAFSCAIVMTSLRPRLEDKWRRLGETDARARELANQELDVMVNRLQQSGRAEYLNVTQRSGNMAEMLTMFSGPALMTSGIYLTALHDLGTALRTGDTNLRRMAVTRLVGTVARNIAYSLLSNFVTAQGLVMLFGGDYEEEDKKRILWQSLFTSLFGGITGLVMIGAIVNSAIYMTSDWLASDRKKKMNWKYRLGGSVISFPGVETIIRAGESVFDACVELGEDDFDAEAIARWAFDMGASLNAGVRQVREIAKASGAIEED